MFLCREMAFANGELVEVIDNAPGFKESYSTSTVVECDGGLVTVEYEKLKDYNDNLFVECDGVWATSGIREVEGLQ